MAMLLTSEKARLEAIQARHVAEDKLHKIVGVKGKVHPRSLAEKELLDMMLIACHHPSVASITLALLASQRARFEAVTAQYAAETAVDVAAAKSFLAVRRFMHKAFRG
jgi:hypothetical protein